MKKNYQSTIIIVLLSRYHFGSLSKRFKKFYITININNLFVKIIGIHLKNRLINTTRIPSKWLDSNKHF